MKFSAAAVSLALAASANAHTIFQQVSVNGANQGLGKGIRIPSSNYPIEDVNSANLACNANIGTSADKISIAAGARVGTQWGHVLGGAQFNPDPDNPIAASHKGPIQVYLAKVSNAVSSGTSGLAWFKVHSEGFVNGKSAVDVMIANAGWYYFAMPTCVAPGDYLMRVELIALHNAYNYPGAQFYQSCAQITITGSGTLTNPPTVSLPGAYSSTNPGIKVNIYPPPANYVAPGPAVISCAGAPAPAPAPVQSTTRAAAPSPTPAQTTTRAAAPSPTPVGGTVAKYGQCGGTGYTGPTTCAAGSTCKPNGDYYSQCV